MTKTTPPAQPDSIVTCDDILAQLQKSIDAFGPAPPPLFTRFHAKDKATMHMLEKEIGKARGDGPLKPPFNFRVVPDGVLPKGVLAVAFAQVPFGEQMKPEHMCIITEPKP